MGDGVCNYRSALAWSAGLRCIGIVCPVSQLDRPEGSRNNRLPAGKPEVVERIGLQRPGMRSVAASHFRRWRTDEDDTLFSALVVAISAFKNKQINVMEWLPIFGRVARFDDAWRAVRGSIGEHCLGCGGSKHGDTQVTLASRLIWAARD